jgi:hypothetical protein
MKMQFMRQAVRMATLRIFKVLFGGMPSSFSRRGADGMSALLRAPQQGPAHDVAGDHRDGADAAYETALQKRKLERLLREEGMPYHRAKRIASIMYANE